MTIKSLVAFAVVLGGSIFAQASTPMECALTFKAHGGGVQLIVGHFQLKGTGNIRCVDATGKTEVLPVRVTLGGHPIALRTAVGFFRIAGVATGVGYASSPAALLGRYLVVGADGAFVLGAGAQASLHAKHGAVTLNASIQAEKGLGFNVGLSNLTVEAAN